MVAMSEHWMLQQLYIKTFVCASALEIPIVLYKFSILLSLSCYIISSI